MPNPSRIFAGIWRNDRTASLAASSLPIAVSTVTTPLIARELGPSAYGLWVTVLAAIATVQLVDFGVFSSVYTFMTHAVEKYGPDGVARYLNSATGFYALVATVAATLLVSFWDDVGTYLTERTLAPVGPFIALATLMLFVTPASYCAVFAMQAQGRFARTFVLTAVGQALYVVTLTVAYLSDRFGLAIVAVSFLLGRLVPMLPPIWSSLRQGWPRLLDRDELREFLRFSRGVWGSNLSAAVILQFPFLLLNHRSSPEVVGLYAAASVVATSMRNVPLFSLPPIIRTLTGAPKQIARRARVADRRWVRWLTGYWLVGVPAILVGFPILFGATYRTATVATILLFSGYCIQASGALATNTTRQLGLSGTESLVNMLGAAGFTGLLVILYGNFGISAPGIALILSQIPVVWAQRHYYRRCTPLPEDHVWTQSQAEG